MKLGKEVDHVNSSCWTQSCRTQFRNVLKLTEGGGQAAPPWLLDLQVVKSCSMLLLQPMSQALLGTYWRETVYRGWRNVPLWVRLQVGQFSETILKLQYLHYGPTLQWRLVKLPGPCSKKVCQSVTSANFHFRVSNLKLHLLFRICECIKEVLQARINTSHHSGQVLSALGQKLHPACFLCSHCGKGLKSSILWLNHPDHCYSHQVLAKTF